MSPQKVSHTNSLFCAWAGKAVRKFLVLGLAICAPAAAILINTSDSHATASSITIGISDAPKVNIQPTPEGVFADSGDSTITITTTHAAGYTLTAKASTSTSLTGASTGASLSTLDPNTSIDAATFNTATYNNKWGYRPSKYNSTVNTTYRPSPGLGTTASPLDTLDVTNNSNNGSYTVSIGARVTNDTAFDSYSNAFVFAAVGNPTPYAITYNKNTTDTVSNMPSNHTTSDTGASGETVTLASNTPTRNSYTFQGWCTVAVADGASCTGTTYAASSTWTINQTASSNSLTLYAMWKSAGYTITFKANGGTGSDYTQTIAKGSSDFLSGNSFTRSNYYFKGWGTNTSTVAYRPGQSITPTGNMTLYAIWASSTSSSLYNIVASLNNSRTLDNTSTNGTGLNAKAGIQADITKDNSGVFTYNASIFGTPSDASTSNTIYLYRGILDNVLGTYGSDGDGGNYPNFVLLSTNSTKDTSDTCWRIVRTTGSGGVKMVYSGKWTGSTCANATTAAQVTTSAYNGTSSTYQQIVRVGYTYNSTYATNTSQSGTIAQVFGSNSNPATNNTRSTIKEYIEDTWYANNMTAFTSKLEASAGYCNDRTMNTSTSWTSALAESTTIASTYGTSGQQAYYFGAYPRNMNAAQPPSLTCGNKYDQINRSTVDLYRYVANSTGVSNQLKYPAALLTADELSFAGSGSSTASQGSAYHANSFLRSGSAFWLLSPSSRNANGYALEFTLFTNGYLFNYSVYSTRGVRPSISLTSGTTASSGSGTATDPWVVTAP